MKETSREAFGARSDGLPRRSVLLLLVAVLPFAGGCTRVDVGATAPSTVEPTASSESSPADCYDIQVGEGQGADFSTFGLQESSSLIVVATFKGYGPASWNTPGGERPSRDTVQSGTPVGISRPFKAKANLALKGDTANMIHAVARGGQVGCDSYTFGADPTPLVGDRYVFFFMPIIESEGKLKGDLMLIDAWPVGPDDVVTRRVEGPISLADLADEIAHPIPPTPEPTVEPTPEESGPG